MRKICIWMNMPSHHQSSFFKALSYRDDVDLRVRYYEKIPEARKKLGWGASSNLTLYEQYIDNIDDLKHSLPDWKERIHIIPGFSSPFLRELLDIVIDHKVQWIHWSERSGVGLAKLLQFNYSAYSLLYPLFLYLKGYKSYAKQINQHALGALAIGELAKDDFLKWGIDSEKIEFQPYSLAELEKPKEIASKIKEADMHVFMYIGALNARKGTDTILTAFSNLTFLKLSYKLVLIGSGSKDELYKKQAKELGIEDKVDFLGVVASDNINNYLDQADVFVLPTRFDGWGAVLNEAASLGKPLISTKQAGAAHHLIKDGKNGFMVKASSVAELTQAMQYYINHSDKIQDHDNKSFKIFQNFTPKKVQNYLC